MGEKTFVVGGVPMPASMAIAIARRVNIPTPKFGPPNRQARRAALAHATKAISPPPPAGGVK